eukprot:3834224-Rhodomonas_salina.2
MRVSQSLQTTFNKTKKVIRLHQGSFLLILLHESAIFLLCCSPSRDAPPSSYIHNLLPFLTAGAPVALPPQATATCRQKGSAAACARSNGSGRQYDQDAQLELWRKIRGPFLFPVDFGAHTCEWEPFSFTQAGCTLCGTEHRCPCAACDLESGDDGHVSCMITGFVVREREMRDEWAAPARAYLLPQTLAISSTPSRLRRKQQLNNNTAHANMETLPLPQRGTNKNSLELEIVCTPQAPCETWTFVNNVVREILHSDTTGKCTHLENKRLCTVQTTALHKSIKRQRTKGVVNLIRAASD